jgi:anti-sigma28 factor (negative regulator of flagellin synthesis)
MNPPKPPVISAPLRRMLEESNRRDRRIAELRQAIASGSYTISAVALAESLIASMLQR